MWQAPQTGSSSLGEPCCASRRSFRLCFSPSPALLCPVALHARGAEDWLSSFWLQTHSRQVIIPGVAHWCQVLLKTVQLRLHHRGVETCYIGARCSLSGALRFHPSALLEGSSAAARAAVRRGINSGYRSTYWFNVFGGLCPATVRSWRKLVVVLFVSKKRTHPSESQLMPPEVSDYT